MNDTSRLLAKLGFEAVCVENGEAAIEALRNDTFDLVLMDVQMPVMDGVEATRAIRASTRLDAGIPIIALTAYAMEGDRENFIAAGMNGYVAKPVELDALRDAIDEVLG